MEPRKGDALVVVDVQNDFAHPDGSLYVPGALEAIPTIFEWISKFHRLGLTKHFTIDWHPADHISFKGHGGVWPPHCVQGTWGAELHPRILTALSVFLTRFVSIPKGVDRLVEQYSGFETSMLLPRLEKLDVGRIFVVGLATDYCVKATVLDGLSAGFEVVVVSDGVAGVNINPYDVARALKEIEDAGAIILKEED